MKRNKTNKTEEKKLTAIWPMPLNLAVSQMLKIGKLPVPFGFGGRVSVEQPVRGPDWYCCSP